MLFFRLRSLGIAGGLFLAIVGTGAAQAQVTCPATVPGQAGAVFFVGSVNACTNGQAGAYSNATLASQALTELSQSATQETTRTATSAIADRRQTEAQRCPEGFERVGDSCRRVAEVTTPSPTSPAPASATKSSKKRAAPVVASPRLVYKAPPAVIVDQGARFATWARVFGDYERRTGSGRLPPFP